MNSTKPNWVSASVIATAPSTRIITFHGVVPLGVLPREQRPGPLASGIVNSRNMMAGGTTQIGSARVTRR